MLTALAITSCLIRLVSDSFTSLLLMFNASTVIEYSFILYPCLAEIMIQMITVAIDKAHWVNERISNHVSTLLDLSQPDANFVVLPLGEVDQYESRLPLSPSMICACLG